MCVLGSVRFKSQHPFIMFLYLYKNVFLHLLVSRFTSPSFYPVWLLLHAEARQCQTVPVSNRSSSLRVKCDARLWVHAYFLQTSAKQQWTHLKFSQKRGWLIFLHEVLLRPLTYKCSSHHHEIMHFMTVRFLREIALLTRQQKNRVTVCFNLQSVQISL